MEYNKAIKPAPLTEQALYQIVEQFIAVGARMGAAPFLKILRFLRRNEQPFGENKQGITPLVGPFHLAKDSTVALLLFALHSPQSRLIDDLSGRYGYSHLTVDVGEIDTPTGKPVMTESMPNSPVHRSFQDEYGPRPFLRVPINGWLARYGMTPAEFRACVQDKLGEAYDVVEVLTWGRIDDPVRQVCSDLAAVCLPEGMREEFARQQRAGLLPHSVTIHRSKAGANGRGGSGTLRLFVSPNGFARFFNAPYGNQVTRPGQVFVSNPKSDHTVWKTVRRIGNILARVLVIAAAVVAVRVVLRRLTSSETTRWARLPVTQGCASLCVRIKEGIMASASPSEPSELVPEPIKDSIISAKHLTKKFADETASGPVQPG